MTEDDDTTDAAERTREETESTDGEAEPTEGETESTEGETEPTEGETESTEGETESTEGETESTEGETESIEGETEPTEGETESTDRRLVEGWQGRYYEDFEVGDVYKHPYGRTVTETDNVWMTNVTMNLNPMHFNEAYAAETEFGERLVDGTYVFALAVGMSVIDVSQNATANLGYDSVRHHAPVYHGDTIFAESEVLSKRELDSREHVGIVTTELRAYNQDDELVLSLERTPMVRKREHANPSAAQPPGWPDGVGTQPEDCRDESQTAGDGGMDAGGPEEGSR